MISREELYGLVWSEPMTKISARFDVSGSYLARICTLLNVPRPERGYWAKLAVGKASAPVPLPAALPGDPLHWSKGSEPVRAARPRAPAVRDRKTRPITVPRTRTHPLLHGAKLHFLNGRPVEERAYLRPLKRLLLDVNASLPFLDSALGLANDIFNALASVGHRVVLAPSAEGLRRPPIDEREQGGAPRDPWHYGRLWSPARPTVVYVGTVAVGLAIVEMSEIALLRYVNGTYVRDSDYVPPRGPYGDHSWTTTREVPSGRARLVAYSPYPGVNWSRTWQDGGPSNVRALIRTIVEEIEASAPLLVAKLDEAERQAEIRRQEWAAEQERARRIEDKRRVEKSIADSQAELGAVIDEYNRLAGIERFLLGVEARVSELPAEQRSAVAERLALAREFLGSHDPLDLIRNWKIPAERYAPLYSAEGEPLA